MKALTQKLLATISLFVAIQNSVFAQDEANTNELTSYLWSYGLPLLGLVSILVFAWLSSREKPGSKKAAR